MVGEDSVKKSMVPRWCAGLLACLAFSPVQALTLWQAYEAALQHDPTFISAKYEKEVGQEYRNIGRSSLLPVLSASYSQYKNRADDITQTSLGPVASHPEYTSKSAVVNLRQPVINFDSLARYRQGLAQTELSDATFASRKHELMLRVLSAYVDVLFAQDQLTLATAQRDTLAEHRRLNDRIYAKGEGTRTDMLETQAKLDVAEAQMLDARDNVASTKNALAALIGAPVNSVDGLHKNFRVQVLQPADFDGWRALALGKNPELLAQNRSIEVAAQEIKKSRAGHAPRLDFVASFSKGESESLTTNNRDQTVRSVGVQLNIPLYSGGYVNAVSRQAVAGHEKAKADLNVRTDRIMQELRKQFNLVQSSAARIDALQKAVDSGRLLVQATQQSIKGGVRINLDLLNARQQFYTTQRDLAQAKYNYLHGWLRLRAAAGVLEADDMRQLSAYFYETK